MHCQLCGKFGHLRHICFHRFIVRFFGVTDTSYTSPNTPSAHMSSTKWDDTHEVESPYHNKSLHSPSNQLLPSSLQFPLRNVSPYIPTIYPYMYHTPPRVAYIVSPNVSPAVSYVFPFVFQVAQTNGSTPGQSLIIPQVNMHVSQLLYMSIPTGILTQAQPITLPMHLRFLR